MQTTIAEYRWMYRRFVTVRYWNYSLGAAIGLGIAIASSQITEGGYWMKLIAVIAVAGVVVVDVFTAIALHGYYRSMMQQSERLGDFQFAPSISTVQSVFLFSIAPTITFTVSSIAVIAFCRIY